MSLQRQGDSRLSSSCWHCAELRCARGAFKAPRLAYINTTKLLLTRGGVLSIISFFKGRRFEVDIRQRLRKIQREYQELVCVTPQEEVKLRDGRSKYIDFAFSYKTLASEHMIAIECQHRSHWSSEILDKILTVRSHSFRNRFWFVYKSDGFLSRDTALLLDSHGIMHFSSRVFDGFLNNIRSELEATQLVIRLREASELRVRLERDKLRDELLASKLNSDWVRASSYESPKRDSAMISR